jgi:hypothetical protein
MAIDEQILRSLIEAGSAAPSGDNCQPWRITVRDDTVRLYNLPARDISLFNFNQRASLVAHGAFIENVCIAAPAHGLKAMVTLFPDSGEKELVSEIQFLPSGGEIDPLVKVIPERCTNRRRYRGGVLDSKQMEILASTAAGFPQAQVRLFTGSDQNRLSGVISLNDRMIFENRELHSFLFDHIRWNDAEAEEAKDGMDIRTLELDAPTTYAFRLFRNFDFVSMLNRFGVSRMIGMNAKKMAMSAAAIGIITMREESPVDFITSGRVLERVWLEATRQGLSFQMMTGITFLMGRIASGDPGTLTPNQVVMVRRGRSELAAVLGNEQDVPLIMFRVGRADPPTARSLRLPVTV